MSYEINEAVARPSRRLKARYLIALFIVFVSIVTTPFFIELAYQERGYQAIGGEYMIIPFGIVLAAAVLSVASDIEKARGCRSGNKVHEVPSVVENPTMG